MGRMGVSITKSCSFRGAAQEFSNTYYYEFGTAATATIGDQLIDLIVALEKPMHSPAITFVRARAWSAGGTAAENNTLATKNLSGAGTGPAELTTMDRERAFLVRFRAGSDSRGRPVYLRKWWHLMIGAVGGSSISVGQLANTATLDTTQRNQLVSWADSFKQLAPAALGGVGPATLVSDKGRNISGATTAHQYLEHHQLGDMWR